MDLNATPSANRVHIGFFGRRNAGKSSLVNAFTGQDLVIVSEIPGTTTDPVSKSMELLPLGPVLIIDTPGIDDSGALGELRVRKARQVLDKTGVAVLVVDAAGADGGGLAESDRELIALFREKDIPFIIAFNKSDRLSVESLPEGGDAGEGGRAAPDKNAAASLIKEGLIDAFITGAAAVSRNGKPELEYEEAIFVSAKTGAGVNELKERVARLAKTGEPERRIVGDLLRPGDFVVLVVPIDSAAPKGRLILPQQQTIRDALESGAVAVVTRETELPGALAGLGKPPALVVTDSQAFARVAADTPRGVPLTSFSILFARYKGFLAPAVAGVRALDAAGDGDTILICEGCTHHRQCDDIGTVKLPRWIREHTGRAPRFAFTSGTEFPDDLSPYALVIHCGACMLGEREVRARAARAAGQGVPFTNYGVAIAHIRGILPRCLEVFSGLAAGLTESPAGSVKS